jgi:uncharacterized protein DUF6428
MKLLDFITVLEQNSNKELLFEYASGKFTERNYHLTEVKNVQFDTTDCGGKTNFWEETHFQIWESPKEMGKNNYIKTDKILSILNRVETIKPLKRDTELKIEYGNENFPTSVMPIEKIDFYDDKLIVSLFAEATRCKANDICGFTEEIEETACCTDTKCC